jgi:hypothetical protein
MNRLHWVRFKPLTAEEFCQHFELSLEECKESYLEWCNEYKKLTRKFYGYQNERLSHSKSNKFSDDEEYYNNTEEYLPNILQKLIQDEIDLFHLLINERHSGPQHISSLLANALQFDYDISSRKITLDKAKALWFNVNITGISEHELAQIKPFDYKYYLNTAHWEKVRAAMLLLYESRCKLCSDQNWDLFLSSPAGNNHRRLDVHHLTYRNIGHERYEDLVLLCHEHHEREHSK